MAGNPSYRVAMSTDPVLLKMARHVPLHPPKDKGVLYAEDEGSRLAKAFVAANPGYTRLDELLARSHQGQVLWSALTEGGL